MALLSGDLFKFYLVNDLTFFTTLMHLLTLMR